MTAVVQFFHESCGVYRRCASSLGGTLPPRSRVGPRTVQGSGHASRESCTGSSLRGQRPLAFSILCLSFVCPFDLMVRTPFDSPLFAHYVLRPSRIAAGDAPGLTAIYSRPVDSPIITAIAPIPTPVPIPITYISKHTNIVSFLSSVSVSESPGHPAQATQPRPPSPDRGEWFRRAASAAAARRHPSHRILLTY